MRDTSTFEMKKWDVQFRVSKHDEAGGHIYVWAPDLVEAAREAVRFCVADFGPQVIVWGVSDNNEGCGDS